MKKYSDLDLENETSELVAHLFEHCISVDVETSGTDPVKSGILSIGACNFKNKNYFYIENKLREDAYVDDYSLKVNGFTKEDIYDVNKANELEALQALIEFANQNKTFLIIGKNPQFDYNFLKNIWIRNGMSLNDFPFSYRLIDISGFVISSWLQARNPIPEKGLSSGAIQNILDVEEEPKPHNALNGAKMNKLCVISWVEKYVI